MALSPTGTSKGVGISIGSSSRVLILSYMGGPSPCILRALKETTYSPVIWPLRSSSEGGSQCMVIEVELVTSKVTLFGGSEGVEENVFTFISFEGSPMPFLLKGTTVIVYSVKGLSSIYLVIFVPRFLCHWLETTSTGFLIGSIQLSVTKRGLTICATRSRGGPGRRFIRPEPKSPDEPTMA
ncbi:hypothetical protein FF38_02985 [Lucilia cuprina]|uniref:Uncharacterized protein n=1 Tax=Lucilia cuprina TaxID=7375 RepID=A0A0L0CN22_LUCCU|nr:hypothetical protein FF38_02985 [Lucilia cuprina]